ncbi:MAG TPA: cyclic nucleotide-binding domain-containing protein [Alphaproteobacteria bacterium]|nr:cyclic nucleotide-binding domain-containing protein [Alphaproteobacteria bacterium]
MLKSFKASQFLFEQGDDAAEALRVVEGTVEVVRRIGRSQVLIETVAPGGFVGELDILLHRPRGATAQAASTVTVETLSREEFLDHARRDPAATEALLTRAGARLRGVDDPLLETLRREFDGIAQRSQARTPAVTASSPDTASGAASGTQARPSPATPTIEIKAATASLVALIGADPIPVVRLPFMVGRMADKHEQDMIVEPDLPLKEPPPHHLSRRHFLIYAQDGAHYVRDLESTLGTTVNGVSIGRKFPSNVAGLEPGENWITAGDANSSYVFVITIS